MQLFQFFLHSLKLYLKFHFSVLLVDFEDVCYINTCAGQGKKRDKPKIVAHLESAYIKAIVGDPDTSAAAISGRIKAVTKHWVSLVINDLVPWSDYVASTKLTKDATDYETDNVATTLIKRMQKRDPEKVVAVGDRFSYLVIDSTDKKAKKRDICELTKEVVRQNLSVNIDYYLENVMGNTIAKFLNIAGVQGKDVSRYVDSCKKPDYCEKLIPKKKQKLAPLSLGGMVLIKSPTCESCRRPLTISPGSGNDKVCRACAETEHGARIRRTKQEQESTVRAHRDEYEKACKACREEHMKKNGLDATIPDIEEAVKACENDECSVWVSRAWARKRLP